MSGWILAAPTNLTPHDVADGDLWGEIFRLLRPSNSLERGLAFVLSILFLTAVVTAMGALWRYRSVGAGGHDGRTVPIGDRRSASWPG